jgi:ATP-dependent Clp protease adapter protein ClpS
MQTVHATSTCARRIARAATATRDLQLEELLGNAFDELWSVVVLNDDVTTFATVITALVEIFHHTPEAAETLAWTVHRTGRAQVAVGDRVFALEGVEALHHRGIQAIAEPLGHAAE